jgi:selenide,water dikinase
MKRLVLLGGGHANIEVLRQLALRPAGELHDLSVSLVTPRPWLIYTGMLPGHIAGHYGFNECAIDLKLLAHRARADVVQTTASLVSPDANEVVCADGTVLGYDALSVNVGSRPQVGTARGVDAHAFRVRPLERVIEGWNAVYARTAQEEVDSITIVGGGAGGIELALAMNYRLRSTLDPPHPKVRLLADAMGADLLPRTRRLLALQMRRAGVDFHFGSAVAEVGRDFVRLESGIEFATEATFWVTGPASQDWIRDSGLSVDAGGYLLTNPALQSLSHPNVFGAGDCASIEGEPRPKAGVFAVHAAPVLADNLLAAITGGTLRPHVPQRNYLSLISAGEQRAVGAWNGLSWQGRWVWRWKDRIDRRFTALYRAEATIR